MGKKVFIDCGANNGCSVDLFRRIYANHAEFEIHCFEGNSKFEKDLLDRTPNVHISLVWVDDNGASFDGWRMTRFGKGSTSYVQSIDISKWIQDNFTQDDYIILKLDIEGAEYDVIDKMYNDGTLNLIDELYGELHGPKTGHSNQHDIRLMNQLSEYNLKMYLWDALETDALSGDYYTPEFMETVMYPTWRKRGYKI